mmetsp:Transcript_2417/g.4445  ORF Transcript_2417/g.4445 Transcript_2417/m.4445 type:complete len:617 (+) Transcript_2417:49-1899(+)
MPKSVVDNQALRDALQHSLQKAKRSVEQALDEGYEQAVEKISALEAARAEAVAKCRELQEHNAELSSGIAGLLAGERPEAIPGRVSDKIGKASSPSALPKLAVVPDGSSYKGPVRSSRSFTDPAARPLEENEYKRSMAPKPSPRLNSGNSQSSEHNFFKRVQEILGTSNEQEEDGNRLFADVNKIKSRIRDHIAEPKATPWDEHYHSEGFFQRIVRHHWFEHGTLVLIALNAIWIAIDTDYNQALVLSDADWIFQVVENAFCLFFTAEWALRFCAMKNERHVIYHRWLLFDMVLVSLMIFEIWVVGIAILATGAKLSGTDASKATVLRLFRILRLARMARMARLFRAVPELMIMIKGMAVASRSVLVTISMLIIILYIFGIAFTQLMDGSEAGQMYFPDVATSMTSLINHGVLLDSATGLLTAVAEVSEVFRFLLLLFIMLANFTILNMLIGVMCETIRMVSEAESEETLVANACRDLQAMLQSSGLDANGDMMISREEFCSMLEVREACLCIKHLGVDVVALVDQADFIFKDTEELPFDDFMELVLELRGCNHVTVKDVIELRKAVKAELIKTQLETRKLQSLILMNSPHAQASPSRGQSAPPGKLFQLLNEELN